MRLKNAEISTKNIKYALITYKVFSCIPGENNDIYWENYLASGFHVKSVKFLNILLNFNIYF